jgi:hypothetical protein
MFMETSLFLILLIAAWIASAGPEASGCNVCHSKNPKIVEIREELGFKNCFTCHGRGVERTLEEQKAQMIRRRALYPLS